MSDENENSIGVGLQAMANVAVADTINTILHPVYTAKVIIGLEHERGIPEKIRDERKRIVDKRRIRALDQG